MNKSDFDSVTFLNASIKNKLLNKTIPMLELLAEKLRGRGCDDINSDEAGFSEAEMVLLNMEYCKINGSISSDIKDGMFARKLGRESNMVVVASEVLKQYIVENVGYDDE